MDGLELQGRVALVTGAAGGIGSAISRDLASLGVAVAVCDMNETGAKEVAASLGKAAAFGVDLTDRAAVTRLAADVAEQLGPVDVFINNAGWDKAGPFIESQPEDWDRLIAVNLFPAIQLTHALLPGMLERGWGRLVYISSDAARAGSTGEAVYGACKAGLIGFSKTIARESARAGVTSNVVCPGPTDTQLLRDVFVGREKLMDSLTRAVPMGRLGAPEDVAGAVAYLCSPRAAYVTGQTVSVSGGLTMA